MDSSILLAIPAVAVLKILVDSLRDPEADKLGDITWKIYGTLCKQRNTRSLDNVGTILWPKVMRVKRLLKQQDIADESYVRDIVAMICISNNQLTEELEAYTTARKTETKKWKRQSSKVRIRGALIELALMILQVEPFRNHLTSVFGYTYARDEEEGGSLGDRNDKQLDMQGKQVEMHGK
jgi:hypothetical protein